MDTVGAMIRFLLFFIILLCPSFASAAYISTSVYVSGDCTINDKSYPSGGANVNYPLHSTIVVKPLFYDQLIKVDYSIGPSQSNSVMYYLNMALVYPSVYSINVSNYVWSLSVSCVPVPANLTVVQPSPSSISIVSNTYDDYVCDDMEYDESQEQYYCASGHDELRDYSNGGQVTQSESLHFSVNSVLTSPVTSVTITSNLSTYTFTSFPFDFIVPKGTDYLHVSAITTVVTPPSSVDTKPISDAYNQRAMAFIGLSAASVFAFTWRA